MERIKYYNTRLESFHLDTKELYKLMGYGEHTPQQYIQDMVYEMLSYLKTICRPRCGYLICSGGIFEKKHVKVDDSILNTGAIIATAMKEAEYIAVFTATLGEEFDQLLYELKQEDDILKDFIANSLGSILAEGVTEQLMKELERNVSIDKLYTSNNYSPGYCDWPLTEQQKLFSILPPHITGIHLTDSCLMLPIKSVSGIVGIGKKVIKRPYKCEICKMKNCVKNKILREKKISTS